MVTGVCQCVRGVRTERDVNQTAFISLIHAWGAPDEAYHVRNVITKERANENNWSKRKSTNHFAHTARDDEAEHQEKFKDTLAMSTFRICWSYTKLQ